MKYFHLAGHSLLSPPPSPLNHLFPSQRIKVLKQRFFEIYVLSFFPCPLCALFPTKYEWDSITDRCQAPALAGIPQKIIIFFMRVPPLRKPGQDSSPSAVNDSYGAMPRVACPPLLCPFKWRVFLPSTACGFLPLLFWRPFLSDPTYFLFSSLHRSPRPTRSSTPPIKVVIGRFVRSPPIRSVPSWAVSSSSLLFYLFFLPFRSLKPAHPSTDSSFQTPSIYSPPSI